MSDTLTRVHKNFGGKSFNYYVRFGRPVCFEKQNKHEAFEYYARGSVFCYVRWQANDYGTRYWRVFILRTGDETSLIYSVPGINPGAEVLLDVEGASRAKRVLETIDSIEKFGIDPITVAPHYWVQVNARVNTVLNPLPYTSAIHQAWVMQREGEK